jgi:mannose-6-phosphate isomerase-like protein (cupin superfamily)
VNLRDDVEDAAVGFGLSPGIEFRGGRAPLGLEQSGLSYQRLAPGFRVPFGHRHKTQEEVYVVVSGGGRAKLEDEIVELRQWDALRVPRDTMRAFEAGQDGLELLAIGAPGTGPGDADMEQGFWSD